MSLVIRPEQVSDYPLIAEINVLAFDQRATEALIVSLLRHTPGFDPDLSLVAEVDGKAVGHALFTRQQIRLMSKTVHAALLAPLAIHPGYQRQGIGGKLIVAGHIMARKKNCQLSFLLGHSDYYPKFGYRTFAYGSSELVVQQDQRSPAEVLTTRKPLQDDLPALAELWRRAEGNIDFVFHPASMLLEWLSPNPAIEASVYLRGDQIVGYTRIHKEQPESPRAFYALDKEAARGMASHIATQFNLSQVTLPLHPASIGADAFGKMPTVKRWIAGMAMALEPLKLLDDYFAQVETGQRVSGRPIWPVAFEIE